MWQGIVNRAQRSVDTLVTKYVTRIAVAVPFVIALGFGTAAASVKLGEVYGSMLGYAIIAATYAGVGLIAAVAIAAGGPAPIPATDAGNSDAAAAAVDSTAAETSTPATPELILAALATVGPAALPAVLRLVVRNLPLLLAVVVLAYLLFSDRQSGTVDDTPAP